MNHSQTEVPPAFRRTANDLVGQRPAPGEGEVKISPQTERDLKTNGLTPVRNTDLDHLLRSTAENLELRQQLAAAGQQKTSGFGCAVCVAQMRKAWQSLTAQLKDLEPERQQSLIQNAVQMGQLAASQGQPIPNGALPPVRSGDVMVMGTVYCSACAPDMPTPGRQSLLVPPAGMSISTAVQMTSVG